MDKSVEQPHSLADCLPGMVYKCLPDQQWQLLEVSAGATTLTGLPMQSLLNEHSAYSKLIFPDDLARVTEERQRGIDVQGTYDLEYRIIAACGSVKYVHDRGKVCQENNQLVLAGFITDATFRVRQQKQHRHAEKAIVAAALNPHLASGNTTDFYKDITRIAVETLNVDQAGVWLLNDKQDELHLACMYQKDNDAFVSGIVLFAKDFPAYFKALISGRAIDASDAYLDPRTAEFASNYLPTTGVTSLLDATIRVAGEVAGVLCNEQKHHMRYWLDEDISFSGQLADQISQTINNQQRIQAEKKALEADTRNQAKSQFLASMSHEIRTPMNGVLGMTELLRMTPLSNEQKNYVAIIEESGSLLLNIIDEILDFSKLEAGKYQLNETPSELARLFTGVIDLLSSVVSPTTAIKLEIDPKLPASILIDSHRFRQILLNLIGNAIKFTDSGVIHIKAERIHETQWRFSVSDTGIGMSENLLGRLFEPFERAERSQHITGTGLGLAICKRLITLMQGSISVISTPGQGSQFSVELPLAPWKADEKTPSGIPKSNYSGFEKLHVLVAEDNLINQKVIQGLLRPFGIHPDICSNGIEAVSRFSAQPDKYDLILMDCEMPEMDGFTATREIRKIATNNAPVIAALTAHALQEHRERSQACGMNHYLTKPIKIDDLKELLITISS
jgi:signal transduction histidine kinase/CheY-like chemotaxis protein